MVLMQAAFYASEARRRMLFFFDKLRDNYMPFVHHPDAIALAIAFLHHLDDVLDTLCRNVSSCSV